MRMIDGLSFISLMFKRRSIKELLAKNLEIIYGYPLYLLSFLFPRNKNKWLVGSHIGFAGNPKYFFINVVTEHKELSCIWIASSHSEKVHINGLGLPVCYRWSLKGLFHCLTAGKYIYGFHLIDINFWTSGRVKRVNLWHGVGIKNIEFKSNIGSAKAVCDEKNLLSRIYLPYLFKRPHLFLSTSPLMTEHFMECFRIGKERCMEYLYPRCAVFYWTTDTIKKFVGQYESPSSRKLIEELERFDKSYLYMPTWRESRNDYISSAGFDYDKLNEVLKKKNEVFLLKLHPEAVLSLSGMKNYSNILILDKTIDIYPIIPFTSVLITDYSSIYYDYILMQNKDILLFPFDYKEYITQNRDLAFDFDEYTPGKRANNFSELMNYIENDIPLEFNERTWVTEQFWGNICLNSTDKIVELIKQKWEN